MTSMIMALITIVIIMTTVVASLVIYAYYADARTNRKVLKKMFLEVLSQLTDEQTRKIHLPDYGTVFAFLTIAEDVDKFVWIKMFKAVFSQLPPDVLKELEITKLAKDQYGMWADVKHLHRLAVCSKK